LGDRQLERDARLQQRCSSEPTRASDRRRRLGSRDARGHHTELDCFSRSDVSRGFAADRHYANLSDGDGFRALACLRDTGFDACRSERRTWNDQARDSTDP